jgi:peroxiredoxin Q/BCP
MTHIATFSSLSIWHHHNAATLLLRSGNRKNQFSLLSILLYEEWMNDTLKIGAPAPDFELPADNGRLIRLSALKGRKVVLYFYPRDDTSGCTREALDFNGLLREFTNADTDIFGISADSVASHLKFKKKHGLDLPLLADETRVGLEAYGVWVEKSLYGRKFMGIERTTVLIDAQGVIRNIWPKVKVAGHAAEVLAAAAQI